MRARAVGVLLGGLALLTSGCVGIPDSGPIEEAQTGVEPGEQLGYYNDPRPPTPGASPTDIVRGFLDAQAAIPLQTNTAEEFLTESEASRWRHSRTVTYAAASPPQGSNQVTVELDGANQIDPRGSWLGELPRDQQELTFSMRREDGEWRIDQAPDALVVPEPWFGQAFRRVSLFYLDPTGRILVPEPVFVPRGDQLATSLVEALLAGPLGRLRGVERSAVPPGLDIDLSVTPDEQGVAEVNLIGGTAMPSERDASLMVAQLARTLAQDSTLTGFRVTLDGEPVVLPGGLTTFPMDQGQAFDPVGVQSTSLLFGLADGALVLGAPGVTEPAAGPMGTSALGVRSIAVNLTGARVAGVTEDGTSVLLTDVRNADAAVGTVAGGSSDLLPPVWDFADRLWLVDRTAGGAVVSVVQDGRTRDLEVPGVTGRDVSHVLVSRDASRLVAVLDRPGGDQVVVSRLSYAAGGRPVAATRAREIAWDDQPQLSVLDLGWASPTSIAIAHRLSGDLFQVRTMTVDGAPAGLPGLATTVQERPLALVSSPRATDPVYVRTRSGLLDVLDSQVVDPDPTLGYLTYVGG